MGILVGPMARESAAAKGRRYAVEGRLVILRVSDDEIVARCRGDGALYDLGWDPGRRWHCSCPARTDRCAHLTALRLVTIAQP
jgi:uncharacterized Zn finger protein